MKAIRTRPPRWPRPDPPSSCEPRRPGVLRTMLYVWTIAGALVAAMMPLRTSTAPTAGRGLGDWDLLGNARVHGNLTVDGTITGETSAFGWAVVGTTNGVDDTAKLVAAEAAAGSGGTIVLTSNLVAANWTPTHSGFTVLGNGMGGYTITAKAGSAAAVTLAGVARTTWRGVTFDGNGQAADALDISALNPPGTASSLHTFIACQFQNAAVGTNVLQGAPVSEADQNLFIGCYWPGNVTGIKDVATNGQQLCLIGFRIASTTGIELGGAATLNGVSGQIVGHTTGLLLSGTNGQSSRVDFTDVTFEGAHAAGTCDIDGTAGWPARGVYMQGAGPLQAGGSAGVGTCVKIGQNSATLVLRGIAVINGLITNSALNAYLETDAEVVFVSTADVVCTGAGTLDWQKTIGGGAAGTNGTYGFRVTAAGQVQKSFGSGFVAGGPQQTVPTVSIAENFSRYSIGVNTMALTAGTLYLQLMWLPACSVTTVDFYSGGTALVAGGTPHLWGALFDANRNLIAQSADDVAPVWGANAKKSFALAGGPVAVAAGYYYVGLMANVGVPPTLNAFSVGASATFSVISATPVLCGTSDAGLTTTAPPTAAAITVINPRPYCTVS